MINTYNKKLIAVFVASMLLGAVCGCEDESNATPVLVSVNGMSIHESELDANIISMFGSEQALSLGKKEKKQVLESMVISKLIRQQAETELPDDVLQRVDVQAEIYREKILVNHYLKNRIKPSVITNAMVNEYYKKHLDEFGGVPVKQYEILTTSKALSSAERDKFLNDFSTIVKDMPLSQAHEALKKKGHDVIMLKGVLDPALLDKRLFQIVDKLELNENSNILFIDRKPYLSRVVFVKQGKARSLTEVSEKIKEKLKPIHLKESIKATTDQLKAKADIKYLEQGSL